MILPMHDSALSLSRNMVVGQINSEFTVAEAIKGRPPDGCINAGILRLRPNDRLQRLGHLSLSSLTPDTPLPDSGCHPAWE